MIPGENRESLLREYQAIFENAAIGIIYSRGHRIERCNRHVAELFGYSVDQLAGRDAGMLYATTDEYLRLRQAARTELSAGRSYSGNVEMRRKDGTIVLTRLSARQVDPDAPEPTVVWTIEDIDRQRYTELALDLAERELEVIFDSAVAGITLVRNRFIVRCNRRIEELFGFAPGEMTGKSTRVWYRSDEEYQGIGAEAYATLSQDNYHCRQQMFIRRDGSTFWGEVSGRALDPHDPQEGSVWMVEDISERREMLQRLELAQRVFENSSESIMVTDADNCIVSVNRAYERMTGFAAADLLGRNPGDFKSGHHHADFYQAMWHSLRDKDRWQGEIWDRRRDGSIYPKLSCIDVVRDADGKIVNYVAVFSDISERKASEEEANFLAHHDPLTGLSNRLALGLHLGHALAVARRNRTRVAVLFIDLDGFKPVNDRYGHAAGDALLVMLAARLRQMARETDLVVRLGGDEFVIVMEGNFADDDLAEIGADLVAMMAEPCPLATGDVTVSCSIGIAVSPQDGDTAEGLLAGADVAMYRAKAAGRGRYAFFAADGSAKAATT